MAIVLEPMAGVGWTGEGAIAVRLDEDERVRFFRPRTRVSVESGRHRYAIGPAHYMVEAVPAVFDELDQGRSYDVRLPSRVFHEPARATPSSRGLVEVRVRIVLWSSTTELTFDDHERKEKVLYVDATSHENGWKLFWRERHLTLHVRSSFAWHWRRQHPRCSRYGDARLLCASWATKRTPANPLEHRGHGATAPCKPHGAPSRRVSTLMPAGLGHGAR